MVKQLSPTSTKQEKNKLFKLNPSAIKEEFKDYLRKCGIENEIQAVFTKLFSETPRPENGVEFVRTYFGNPSGDKLQDLREEVMNLRLENKKVKEALKTRVSENQRLKDNLLDSNIN